MASDQFGCWGFLDLWRNKTRGSFSAADAGFLAETAAPLATALRQCQARTFVDPATQHRPDLGPVVLTLDDDLRITSRTAASRGWLDALLPPKADEGAIPASVYNVAAQLLAAEQGVDAHPAFARTHLADGFWLALRAANLLKVGLADGSEFGCLGVPSDDAVKLGKLFHGQYFAKAVSGRSEERDTLPGHRLTERDDSPESVARKRAVLRALLIGEPGHLTRA